MSRKRVMMLDLLRGGAMILVVLYHLLFDLVNIAQVNLPHWLTPNTPLVEGVHTGFLWVLFAVSVGAAFSGVVGMFLMIPVASVLYTLLREITDKHLSQKNIDPEKLKAHPPELISHIKKKLSNKKSNKKENEGIKEQSK